MSRYVAFNPSSSEDSEFVEANTLRDIGRILAERCYINQESFEDFRDHLVRIGGGCWQIDGMEIYELRLHPRLREQVNSWRVVA